MEGPKPQVVTEMSFKKPSLRTLVVGIVLAVTVAGAVIAAVFWPDPVDCGQEIANYASEGSISDDCLEEFERGVDRIEDQAAVVAACHDAVEADHAEAWTVPIEFDSTDIDTETGDFQVSGDAHFVTGNGDRIDREYTCTATVDEGGVDVLTAGSS